MLLEKTLEVVKREDNSIGSVSGQSRNQVGKGRAATLERGHELES